MEPTRYARRWKSPSKVGSFVSATNVTGREEEEEMEGAGRTGGGAKAAGAL